MKIFAIGDLHLSFKSNKPMSLFGEHWQDHSEKIEKAWRKQVNAEDYVLIPGDISWAMRLDEAKEDLEWLDKLPGHKICIRGNHDYWWDRPQKLNKSYKTITFLQNTAFILGNKAICGTRGWTNPRSEGATSEDLRLYEREVTRLQLSLEAATAEKVKEIWVMLHYPPSFMGEEPTPIEELMRQYPVSRVIYGHLHDEESWSKVKQGMNEGMVYELVSADFLAFEPLLLETDDEIENED